MASKRIDELDARTVADTDLLPVTPSGGPSGKATVAAIVAEGLSQPNSASSGAGASITIKAADGVTSGAGGSITITPGAQATTGGPGKVVIDTLTVGLGASGVATNTAIGVSALAANTSGSNNTAIGYQAGQKITTGSQNVAIGQSSGKALTTGELNVFLGAQAGQSTTTASSNTFVGLNSGTNNTTGASNTAVGRSSLLVCTTGYNNTAVGMSAGSAITTGTDNSLVGISAGLNITTGTHNVCMGREAGAFHANGSTALTTPTNSVYIGFNSRGLNNSDSNSIVIGHIAIGEGANTVVIGNSSTVQQHFYATRYLKTEGSLAFASSTPAAITANQNDYVLTGSAFQRLNCTTAADITGIAPPTSGAHVDGRMIRLVSVGTATVTLKHNDTGSAAANRIYMHGGNHTSLTVNEWADLVYDSTDNGSGAAGWRIVKYA
jgi:hypothetical protein